MANIDAKIGLRPMEPQNNRARRFNVYASDVGAAIFKNDPVLVSASGGVKANGANSAAFLGSVIDLYDSTMVPVSYLTASTDGFATVVTNPLMRYQIQCSDALTASCIGDTADFVATAGNTSTGTSKYELSVSLKGAGNSGGQMRILGLVDRTDNAWGAHQDLVVIPALNAMISTPVAV